MPETESTTLAAFLSSVAAKQPTPGGGAVAALAGANAAAIGEMVLNYSIGRKATPQFDEPLKKVLAEFTRARAVMLQLMVEDQDAFAALTAAKKLPDGDANKAAVHEAAEACIAVPRAIAATALLLLERADHVAAMCNKYLLSDLAVCGELAMGTLRSALHSVRVNLPEQPEDKRKAIAAESDAEIKRAVELVTSVVKQST